MSQLLTLAVWGTSIWDWITFAGFVILVVFLPRLGPQLKAGLFGGVGAYAVGCLLNGIAVLAWPPGHRPSWLS